MRNARSEVHRRRWRILAAQIVGAFRLGRHDRRPCQGCRNQSRQAAGDPESPHAALSQTTQVSRREQRAKQTWPTSTACGSSPRSASRRASDAGRRHELSRPKHAAADHHARPQGLARGSSRWRTAAAITDRTLSPRTCRHDRQAGVGVMKTEQGEGGLGRSSAAAIEDAWQRRATDAAIEAFAGSLRPTAPSRRPPPARRLAGSAISNRAG